MNCIATLFHRFPKRHLLSLLGVLGLFGGSFSTLQAQETCTYTIEMSDSFGDGWNGGVMTVVSNGVTTTHTLPFGTAATSTFEVVNGGSITVTWSPGSWPNEPGFTLLDASGTIIASSGGNPIPVGVVYAGVACCSSTCDGPNPNLIVINQVTDTSAHVNWANVTGSIQYLVQYGPEGFPYGSGIEIQTTASEATLLGLNACVTYDVYIANICDNGGKSCPIGPYKVTPDCDGDAPGPECTYTLELFNTFGFGWSNASLQVVFQGTPTNYTMFFGTETILPIAIPSNVEVTISYLAGFDDTGNSFNILDPDGNVIYSATAPPVPGQVANFIACADCQRPLSKFMKDVNADNATIAWENYPGADGEYLIEYGPFGFTWGTGTLLSVPADELKYKFTGLQENTLYDVYIRQDCGNGELSLPDNPITFRTLWLNDIGVSGVLAPGSDQCDFGPNEEVTIALTNFGQVPQTLFEFYFAVNGELAPIPQPQDGLFTGVIGNDSTETIAFETTWDFSEPGIYILEAWTALEGDSQRHNDTTRTEILTAFLKPIVEDFEDNAVHPNWDFFGIDAGIYPDGAHGNETYVFGTRIFAFNGPSQLTTYKFGEIETGDTLFFDYRLVDAFSPDFEAFIFGEDNVKVQISDDCGDSFETVYTIDESNHDPSTDMATVAIPLSQYNGKSIILRFEAESFNNYYWLDIDNINLFGCSGNLGLIGDINGSLQGGATGSITVDPYFGIAPYTFEWDNGQLTGTITDLPVGTYEVTVTDATGCVDSKTFEVGIFTDTYEQSGIEALSLFPNPTSGTATLDIRLTNSMDVRTRVFNLNGQVVFESEAGNTSAVNQTLDLHNEAPGMYLLQVVADGKPFYAKLMVAR